MGGLVEGAKYNSGVISSFLGSFRGNPAFRQRFFALTPSLPILVHQMRCVDGCSSG
jgi:hypothetical protein